jgi:hypothetical protein
MEISDVRKRVHETMAYAKRQAAERRTAADHASGEFDTFLQRTAVPLVRQIANVLQADSYLFTVFTPSGSVRLMSDRSADDFIEIQLDTSGDAPRVIGHVKRSRGRRVVESEETVGSGDPGAITEGELLEFLLRALEPFVER